MQSLQQVRKNFQSLGFSPKLKPFNRKILTIHLVSSLAVVLLWVFLFSNPIGAGRLIESVHIASIGCCLYLGFFADILVRERLFLFFNKFDEVLNESKWESNLSKILNKY